MEINKLNSILKLSKANKVATMRESNLNYLITFLKNNPNLKTILEIGTGCGYSSYKLSEIDSITKIISVEKDIKRYQIAKDLLVDNKKIELLNVDVNDFYKNKSNLSKFDLIILDGPKNNLIHLFEQSLDLLNQKGACVIDNFFLNDIRKKHKDNFQKRLENLIKKNNELQKYIYQLDKKIYNIFIDKSGDGLLIIQLV